MNEYAEIERNENSIQPFIFSKNQNGKCKKLNLFNGGGSKRGQWWQFKRWRNQIGEEEVVGGGGCRGQNQIGNEVGVWWVWLGYKY